MLVESGIDPHLWTDGSVPARWTSPLVHCIVAVPSIRPHGPGTEQTQEVARPCGTRISCRNTHHAGGVGKKDFCAQGRAQPDRHPRQGLRARGAPAPAQPGDEARGEAAECVGGWRSDKAAAERLIPPSLSQRSNQKADVVFAL